MNTFPLSFPSAAVAATLLSLLALAPAEALAGGRSTVVQGRRGATYYRDVHRTPGNFSASGSVTLPDGRVASRSIISQKTATGRTTSAQATGFNGRAATYDSTRTRTENGFERQVNRTGPNGGAASKHVTVANEGDTRTRTVTRSHTPPPR